MTSELKLVIEDAGSLSEQARPDVTSLNPVDALNRRDIELIKKSLVGMHRDSEQLRTTIVALHQHNTNTPSKSFFLALGLVALMIVLGLLAVSPQLEAAAQRVPLLARTSDDVTPR